MKVRSMVMLALSGCLAASILYTTPALAADDDIDGDEPLQFLADNNSSQSNYNMGSSNATTGSMGSATTTGTPPKQWFSNLS